LLLTNTAHTRRKTSTIYSPLPFRGTLRYEATVVILTLLYLPVVVVLLYVLLKTLFGGYTGVFLDSNKTIMAYSDTQTLQRVVSLIESFKSSLKC